MRPPDTAHHNPPAQKVHELPTVREATSPNDKERGALGLARRNIPTFPCKRNKSPLTKNGFKDASNKVEQVRHWWRRWPDANPAYPTGEASGLLVLDVDPKHGGVESLVALEREHGPLPETTRVRTGGGGIHLVFRYPTGSDIRCSAGVLGPGLDVRAEGGYALAPPSENGSGPYFFANKATPAELPPWLLGLMLRDREQEAGDRMEGRGGVAPTQVRRIVEDGEPIPRGSRNNTLAQVAGRLHDGHKSLEDLQRELLAINAAQCDPSLEEGEVRRIARSVHRYPREGRRARPKADAKTLAAVDAFEAAYVTPCEHKGMGGGSRLSLKKVLVLMAREGAELTLRGACITASRRALAERVRLSHTAVNKHLQAMREAGEIAFDNGFRSGTGKGRIVLLTDRAKGFHNEASRPPQPDALDCGNLLRAPYSAPRLRWSNKDVSRLGKSKEKVIDILEHAGTVEEEELAGLCGVSRTRDLRRRYLKPLAECGIVEVADYGWRLTENWREALEVVLEEERAAEREVYGGKTADEMQRERHDRARRGEEAWSFLRTVNQGPDRAPSYEELDEERTRIAAKRSASMAEGERSRLVKTAVGERYTNPHKQRLSEEEKMQRAYDLKVQGAMESLGRAFEELARKRGAA